MNKYASEVIIQRKAHTRKTHPRKTQTASIITHLKIWLRLEPIAEFRDQRIYKLLLLLLYIMLIVCLWIKHTTGVRPSFTWMQSREHYLNYFLTCYVWLETGVWCRWSIRLSNIVVFVPHHSLASYVILQQKLYLFKTLKLTNIVSKRYIS